MAALTVNFFDPIKRRNLKTAVDDTMTGAEAVEHLISLDVIPHPDNIFLEIIGKDRNIENDESFKNAFVQNEDIILIKRCISLYSGKEKFNIYATVRNNKIKKDDDNDVRVNFIHPKDGSILSVTLDHTMTEAEAVSELIACNFIQLNNLGYKIGLKGGRFFRNNERFIDMGIKDNCYIIIKPNRCIKLFISYAKEDCHKAIRLYEELKKQTGIIPWIDSERLLPGEKWRPAIKDAIRDSQFFITLLSKNSVTKNGFVQSEIREALDKLDEYPEPKIFLIPVRLEKCCPSHSALHELHWVDLFPSWDEGINKILQAIQYE